MADHAVTEAKTKFGPYAKAIGGALVAAALAFFGALSTALAAEGVTFGDLTDGQWVTAVVAALGALPLVGGSVYALTNRPAPGTTISGPTEQSIA